MVQLSDKLANHFKKDVHWCTKTPFVSTSKVFFFYGSARALEEKVWQYPFVRHLSFLLYFTFKISARRTSFLLSVRPTCFLNFTFCSQRRDWTLNTAPLLLFTNPKSGISKPSTQFNIYIFCICLWIPQLSHNDKRQMSLNLIHLFEL